MDGWALFRKLSSKLKRSKRTTSVKSPIVIDAVTSPPAMSSPTAVPETQRILLLYGPKQPYQVVDNYAVPKLQGNEEVLVRTNTIGLNPIDWKAP